MTDRELLEAAAKAAGMEHMRWSGPMGLVRMIDPSRPETTGSIGGWWNPLTDDGDALRLAVKLGMDTVGDGRLPDGSPCMSVVFPLLDDFDCISELVRDGDEYSAMRRAIVRAAAAIGAQ